MAQTNYTPISLYYSATASNVPTAANLVQGELAINTADGKLYYEDSSGVVQVLATKSTGSIGGSNTQVQFNNSGSLGGSSGLTWDGSFLTTSSIKNSALTSGRVTYAGASGLLSDSSTLTYNGTNLLTITANSSELVLAGGSSAAQGGFLTISRGGTSKILIGTASNVIGGGSNTSDDLTLFATANTRFYASSTEGMRLTSTGLGIGTSSPVVPLNIVGQTTSTSTPLLYLQQGGSFPNYGYTFAIDNQTTGNLLLRRYGSNTNTDLGTLLSVTTTGSVGIGVDSTAYKLEVAGTIYTNNGSADNLLSINGDGAIKSGVQFKANGGGPYTTMYFDNSTNNTYYKNLAGGGHLFYNGTTQAMTLDNGGNLYVGRTSDTQDAGISLVGNGFIRANRDGDVVMVVNRNTNDGAIVAFRRSGSTVGSIDVTTLLTTYNTTSDYRLKENIVPMTGALAKVAQLKPVTYKWKLNGSDGQGFIAHELAEVVPDCVTGKKDAIDKDGEPVYQGIDTSQLVATLVSAIQELKAEVDSLKQQLNGA